MPKMIYICILLIYFKVISKKGGHYCPRLPYLKVLNFQETVEKSIKVHIKRVLLLINNYVCYFAGASFEAIVCKKIFCGGKSHSCRRRPIILPASRSFPANRSIG